MEIPAILTVVSIFGNKEIDKLIQNFDFSTIDVNQREREDHLTHGLAPAYGGLNSITLEAMDKDLRAMIAGTMKLLAEIPVEKRNWNTVLAAMMDNPSIQPCDGAVIQRNDRYLSEDARFFDFESKSKSSVNREVLTWFTALINDDDVLQSTKIDINVVGDIVGRVGAAVDSFVAAFYSQSNYDKRIVDVGVLRFPDPDHPFFKLYRIELNVWSHCERIIGWQKNENGITGEYKCRSFEPRKSVMARITESQRENIDKDLEHLFGK